MRASVWPTTVILISGHFKAITDIVGPPTYPASNKYFDFHFINFIFEIYFYLNYHWYCLTSKSFI
jgi:hypothetical protein